MRRTILLGAIVVGSLAALATGIVLAFFTASQQASGEISVAESSDVSLYICEPTGPGTADPLCPGDDSGADEIIFEGTEKARPGETFQWDIRLRNKGTFAWDVTAVGITATSSSPTACEIGKSIKAINFSILGKAGDSANDNHLAPSYSGSMPHDSSAEIVREGLSPADKAVIHVEPGDYEDVRLRVVFTPGMDNNCLGVTFTITYRFDITTH